MRETIRYIYEEEEFNLLFSRFDKFFSLDGDLPHQIFRQPACKFSFSDYDILLSKDFWSHMPKLSEDRVDEICVYMHQPSGGAELLRRTGVYGMLIASTSATANQYEIATANPFSRESFDCMNIISTKIFMLPTSSKWFAFACRKLEICIIAHPTLAAGDLGPDWFSANDALDLYGLNNRLKIGDEQFKRIFLDSYSNH